MSSNSSKDSNNLKTFKEVSKSVSTVFSGINAISESSMIISLSTKTFFIFSKSSGLEVVGLFGTVWGIMNSFRGLAGASQATLSAVAPGISEALVATAIGLFAAIPALIAYNKFISESDTLLSNFEGFMEEFSAVLHREIHSTK